MREEKQLVWAGIEPWSSCLASQVIALTTRPGLLRPDHDFKVSYNDASSSHIAIVFISVLADQLEVGITNFVLFKDFELSSARSSFFHAWLIDTHPIRWTDLINTNLMLWEKKGEGKSPATGRIRTHNLLNSRWCATAPGSKSRVHLS